MLIASYLSNRKQRVKLKDSKNSWSTIRRGIPQGSIIGPFLFNIFINDLFCFIDKCDLYNYADDNTLGSANKNIDTLKLDLIHDTKNILEWFTNNGLQANPQKFQTMFLSTHPTQSSIDIPINGINIPTQDKVTLLGVTIDSKLKFNTHISKICSKASKQINVLRRMTNVLDVKSKLAIYQSFIKCHF